MELGRMLNSLTNTEHIIRLKPVKGRT
ncbi:hypothetical protein S40285_09654 [Stachybotrys chlorohalonatus IBT 40285]|uniref:Uncharacterized protein n=1 Tax=Stachybotrys chlorohalonatus (strain IBT 40285) TaxID=1283841 RepID=A0A084R1T3_STAC4|nr:hypothetical protein S40285_09654 [Stachybotrys chlorohalonata IBT 40285]